MSLITQRPRSFNGVVGQDRAVRVLLAVLGNEKFLLRGFIFEGVRGVGKTSTSYLLARALMCTGNDPGCGKCASCVTVDTQGIDTHPDFREVAGAMEAGVGNSREILDAAASLPVLAKRRVVMIDEAHALSSDAWKVYLKPLEEANSNLIILIVSNQGNKIPEEIRGRCCRLKFGRVEEETILGYLANVATQNHIQYELEALRAISRASKGIVREALGILNICAAIGTVTRQLVLDTMDNDLEDASVKILTAVLKQEQQEAVKAVDELCRYESPARVLEAMFITYAKCVYKPENQQQQAVGSYFSNIPAMTTLFMKWTAASQLSSDAMPLFILELLGLNEIKMVRYSAGRSVETDEPASDTASTSEFAAMTGAKPSN